MTYLKAGLALTTALILTACGGGSSGSFDAGREGKLTVTALQTSIEAAAFGCTPPSVQVNVRVTQATGSVVPDGTTVNLSTSDTSIATVESSSATTSGGTAQFRVVSGTETGSVTLTGSTANPSGAGTLTGSATLQVVESTCPAPPPRLTIVGATTMPANEMGVPIFLGSPYINELTVRYLGPDGNAGAVAEGQVAVAIAPVSRGAFSTLDDPETDDVNEFLVLVGSGPVNMTAGVTTLFVHSFEQPGDLTISVTAQDAGTGERFSEDFTIEIEDGAADFLPAEMSFESSADPVYVSGSDGTTTKQYTLTVLDSGGNTVPNPEADGVAFNNVALSLEAPAGSGARLTGTGAEGSVSGSDIQVRSVNGVVRFSLNAGSEVGTHVITASADRADNNVDNGIQDSLVADTSTNVGDGRLHALQIVTPNVSRLQVNPVVGELASNAGPVLDQESGLIIPSRPDGTYSLTVSVQGTDKVGNPALPGTRISFGNFDAPVSPSIPREFVFSGAEGDPEEGGILFSVVDPGEGFLDNPEEIDETVEPGDTLALFGQTVAGNRQHEAARLVASIIDDSTLTVSEMFNLNAPDGEIIDDGSSIPWAIGRSEVGVVDPVATLGADGRASVRLTYPINRLGRPVVFWAQGLRIDADGQQTTVADTESFVFPGAAPLLLRAIPNQIPGNREATVTLCLSDALGAPIEGRFISATIETASAVASVDGFPLGSGAVQTSRATSQNGCLNVDIETQGVLPDDEETAIVFSVGNASARVGVSPAGSAVLSVSPSTFIDQFQGPVNVNLTLRLTDSAGNPISGVELSGECPAEGLRLLGRPGVTDENGFSSVTAEINLFSCDDPIVGSFECTFTTSSGAPTGTFTAIGRAVEDLAFVSPPCS